MWHTGLVAPQHVESSRTRARTRVPCIGRWILNHCATREVPALFSLSKVPKEFFSFSKNPVILLECSPGICHSGSVVSGKQCFFVIFFLMYSSIIYICVCVCVRLYFVCISSVPLLSFLLQGLLLPVCWIFFAYLPYVSFSLKLFHLFIYFFLIFLKILLRG